MRVHLLVSTLVLFFTGSVLCAPINPGLSDNVSTPNPLTTTPSQIDETTQEDTDCLFCGDSIDESSKCPSCYYSCSHNDRWHADCLAEYISGEDLKPGCPFCTAPEVEEPFFSNRILQDLKKAITDGDRELVYEIKGAYHFSKQQLEEAMLLAAQRRDIYIFNILLETRVESESGEKTETERDLLGEILNTILKNEYESQPGRYYLQSIWLRDILPDLLNLDGIPAEPLFKGLSIAIRRKQVALFDLVVNYMNGRPWILQEPEAFVRIMTETKDLGWLKRIERKFKNVLSPKMFLQVWKNKVDAGDVSSLAEFNKFVGWSTAKLPYAESAKIIALIIEKYPEQDMEKLCTFPYFSSISVIHSLVEDQSFLEDEDRRKKIIFLINLLSRKHGKPKDEVIKDLALSHKVEF